MLYESDSGDIEIALTGEALMGGKLSIYREPDYLRMIEMLRAAHVTFSNSECIFQNWEDAPNSYGGGGAPGGSYMAVPPEYIDELKWAGINLIATANNHASDFGEAGILSQLRHLQERGLAHAGTGRNLTEATAPCYLDTPRGRVAMLAAADWGPRGAGDIPWPFPMGVIAGEQSPYSKGRAGVNLVRHRAEVTVPRASFDALRQISEGMGWTSAKDDRRKLSVGFDRPPTSTKMVEDSDTQASFHFMGTKFISGEAYHLTTVAERSDIERNLKWVRDARQMADWVAVSFHNHGATNTPDDPPAHAVSFARECIDHGADIYIGHGTGRDRGIEIYKGKPVFYGLGCFMIQNDRIPWVPYELMARFGLGHDNVPSDFYAKRSGGGTKGHHVITENWESVVPIVRYKGHKLSSIDLHPIDLGISQPAGTRGRPVLAQPGSETYKRVIRRYQAMSAPFGTKITDDGKVVVPAE